MSGIVGIANLDGAPVDRSLLARMTDSLAFRGPDAKRIWIGGQVGFGHTLLRTTYEAERERQPFSFDGETWIVADCRVDAREELVSSLRATGRDTSLDRPDVELILHAWHAWGEECVEHLLGDFAFAIWDAPQRRLFCARDHMGVKPFYYAHVGSTVIFSNTLNCVRLHPAVSDELNDLAVADFLLFGFNQERDTTTFTDVQRIPPAHTAAWTEDGRIRLRRFWTLPIDEPVYFREDREYLDRFRALLRQSVSDRLRTPRVSVFMSGGLDSSALAAVAVSLLGDQPAPDPVCAFTSVFERLMPDDERHYAGLVARRLKIPIRFAVVDREAGWAAPGAQRTPEPAPRLLERNEARQEQQAAMAAHSRVTFFGEGADNALFYEWRPQLRWLASNGRWGRLVADCAKHLAYHKRVPLLPTVPKMFRDRKKRKEWEPVFPGWLDDGFVERLHLRDRQRDKSARTCLHPLRPQAYDSFQDPVWQAIFEEFEPAYTNALVEVRHPYVDIRLLRFLLSVPAVPWCRKKLILRRAFRGLLPEEVLNRPKTPLAKASVVEQAKLHGPPPALSGLKLSSYGHADLIPLGPVSTGTFDVAFRFVALSYWLRDFKIRNMIGDTEDAYEHIKAGLTAGVVPEKVFSAYAAGLR